MRLFTGLSVEESAIPNLAQLRRSANLDWVLPANLHITTKFIGEWPEPRLSELKSTLAEIPWPGTLTITITGLAFLPHVLMAEVQPVAGLLVLAKATEDALHAIGCAREARPYRPHVTLARLRRHQTVRLRETIASMPSLVQASLASSFEATAFHLFKSRASVYTVMATYP